MVLLKDNNSVVNSSTSPKRLKSYEYTKCKCKR